MKRLTFKAEFVPFVLDGSKRFTSRWKSQKLVVGDVVSAVTSQNGRPAFLVPAKDGFARLRITSVEAKFWKDFTDDDAADCCASRDWYLRERPLAQGFDRMYKYGWEILEGCC